MINSLLKNKTPKQSVRRELELKHKVYTQPPHPPPPPFFSGGGERIEPPTKFSKKTGRGLTGSQLLEGAVGKEVGDFFHGGCSFYIKNNLKSEIFNDKKSL